MISGGLSKRIISLIILGYLLAFLSFSFILIFIKVPAYKEVLVTEVSTAASNSFYVVPVNRKDVLEANSIYYLINKQPITVKRLIQTDTAVNAAGYIITLPGKTLQIQYSKGMNFYIYHNVTLINKLKLALMKRYD